MASRLIGHGLLIPMSDALSLLRVSNLDIHLEGKRSTNQVGSEVPALGPHRLAVLVHVGLELEAANDGAASNEEFSFGDFDTRAHTSTHAEAVVAHGDVGCSVRGSLYVGQSGSSHRSGR